MPIRGLCVPTLPAGAETASCGRNLRVRFFKHLLPFRVISFDLDDTLYDNAPAIRRAEQAFADYLQQHYRLPPGTGCGFWRQCRDQVLAEDRSCGDDVTLLRTRVIRLGFSRLGRSVSPGEALELTEIFVTMRSDITVSPEVVRLLRDLRRRYVLAALSNGNVSLGQLGLQELFSLNLRPRYRQLRRKPHADLFELLSSRLQVPPAGILHVGDEPDSDVRGAVLAGCQCAWLDRGYARRLPGLEAISILPHVVLDDIGELRAFL